LAFSTRVDGGSWSRWSVEQSLSLNDVLPGTHFFEVKAKDAWLNEDPTPAELSFEITKPESEARDRPGLANCDCAAAPGRSSTFWVFLVAALLPFRRRKHAP
jgi:MYXO-CTERM domain-containing protein